MVVLNDIDVPVWELFSGMSDNDRDACLIDLLEYDHIKDYIKNNNICGKLNDDDSSSGDDGSNYGPSRGLGDENQDDDDDEYCNEDYFDEIDTTEDNKDDVVEYDITEDNKLLIKSSNREKIIEEINDILDIADENGVDLIFDVSIDKK